MHGAHQHGRKPDDVGRKTVGRARVVCLVIVLGLAGALGLSLMLTTGSANPRRPPIAAAPPAGLDPSRFILNARLVPALDSDAVPLRWVDPRPALHCGPETTVRVNRQALISNALVPDTPFELEWQSDGCRPFGAHGPRFDGWVKLTVFREDWRFSAPVEPSFLRVALAENETTLIQPGAASLPQGVEADEPYELTIGTDRSLRCR